MNRKKIAQAALLLLLIVIFFVKMTVIPATQHTASYGRSDFAVFHAAGWLLHQEKNPYKLGLLHPRLEKIRGYQAGSHFLYPPVTGLLFVPISMVKYKTMAWIWYGFSLLFLLGIFLVVQKLNAKRFTTLQWSAVVAIATLSGAIYANLRLGQVNLLLALLFGIHLIAATKKKYILGGITLATIILFKIFPAILLLYYLIRKEWKMLFATAVAGLALVGTSILFFGIDVHIAYFTVLQELSTGIGVPKDFIKFDNSTIFGTTLRVLTFFQTEFHISDTQYAIANGLRVASGACLLAVLSTLTFLYRKKETHFVLLSLWMSIPLMASVEIQSQYFLFLYPMLLSLLLFTPKSLQKKSQKALIFTATILICLSFLRTLPEAMRNTIVTIIPYAFIGHGILLGVLLPWLYRQVKPTKKEA